jgi:hypothetical protein
MHKESHFRSSHNRLVLYTGKSHVSYLSLSLTHALQNSSVLCTSSCALQLLHTAALLTAPLCYLLLLATVLQSLMCAAKQQ